MSGKPRLLDLFCGAGGCTRGYQQAGLGVGQDDGDWQSKTRRLLGKRGRDLQRHRLFELSFPMLVQPCWHRRDVIGFYGDHARARRRSDPNETENNQDFPDSDRLRLAQVAMGIDWMTWDEIREAIPPAYTELIGHQLRSHLADVGAARRARTAGRAPDTRTTALQKMTTTELEDRVDEWVRNG